MRTLIIIIISTFLISCSVNKSSNTEINERLIESFEQAYQSGQWEQALSYIDTLRARKVNLNILPIEAECYAGLGQHEKAISLLENEIKLDTMKNIYYVHSTLGNVYTHKSNFNKAIEHYKKSIQIRPTYARPYINIGDIYNHLNEKDSCVYYYLSAIKLFAENNFFNEVVDFSQRVISIDSLNIEGYKFLQYGFQSLDNHKDAVSVGLILDDIITSNDLQGSDEKHLNWLFTGISAYKCGDIQLSHELIYSSIQQETVRRDYGWLAYCHLSAIQNKLGNNDLAKQYADIATKVDSMKTAEYIKDLLGQ